MTIGIIDTGIDPDSPEFAGRLSTASADIFGTRSVEGPDDHGTNVALVAAAARNNVGVVGIAWNSTVLAIRADEPGSCGGDSATDTTTQCAFFDGAIADSINYAVGNGAKVINISLGGGSGTTPRLRTAVRDAVSAGALIVVAAGNEGANELEAFASQLANVGAGGVLIVGSVDDAYNISDFSNRAGANPAYYLTARGERICCTYQDGELFVDNEGFSYLFSGTSFAAPQVAGAAALLAQAFPNLTGREIAEILLQTAFDAGEAGADAIYGQGVLDIAAAFQPLGTTRLAGSTSALPLSEATLIASPAMGDALSSVSLPTLVTDRYNRAFATDLGGTIRGAAPRELLLGAVGQGARHISASGSRATVSFAIEANDAAQPLNLVSGDKARVLAAQMALQIATDTKIALGYGSSAMGLSSGLRDTQRPAFMIASGSAGDSGLHARNDAAIAVRQQLGPWGMTISAQTGSAQTGIATSRFASLRGERAEDGVATLGAEFDRRFGALDVSAGLSVMAEERTLLGARFHDGFGLAGADTMFLDADLAWRFAANWRLGAAWREGFTQPHAARLLESGSKLRSRAWSLDLERTGLFTSGDALAVRLSQPLRVEAGALNVLLPVAYDYDTLLPEYAAHSITPVPAGRELIGELSWRGPFLGGQAMTSLFYRRDPGHYNAARADAGMALRWGMRF